MCVMPRSHIHGSPRQFYYGLNLTDTPEMPISVVQYGCRIYVGETGASSASGHVRHVAIFSMKTLICGWGTYLEITCDDFVYMSTQWLHC